MPTPVYFFEVQCRGGQRHQIPGTGVIGLYELPDIGAGN